MRRIRFYLWVSIMAGIAAAAIFAVHRVELALGTGNAIAGFCAGLLAGAAVLYSQLVRRYQRAAQTAPRRPPPMPAPATADYDWTVRKLDGTPFDMDSLKGEIVFLNVFSTTCPPCVAELPSIDRLRSALSAYGVVFMCVATDSDVETVRDFLADKGWSLPVFHHGDADLPRVFDSDYVPATYIVDPAGTIVYEHTGGALWDHPRVIAFLRALSLSHGLAPQNAASGSARDGSLSADRLAV